MKTKQEYQSLSIYEMESIVGGNLIDDIYWCAGYAAGFLATSRAVEFHYSQSRGN